MFLGKQLQELSFLTAQPFAGRCGFAWPIFCHGVDVTWTCSCSNTPKVKSSSAWSSGIWFLPKSFPCCCSSRATLPPAPHVAQSILALLRGDSLYFPCETQMVFSHQATEEGSANLCTSFHVTVELQEFLLMLCSPFGLWKQHKRARNSGGGEYSLQGHRTDLAVIDIFWSYNHPSKNRIKSLSFISLSGS